MVLEEWTPNQLVLFTSRQSFVYTLAAARVTAISFSQLGCKFPVDETRVLYGTISFSLGFVTRRCELRQQVESLALSHFTTFSSAWTLLTH